jgi:hypothetical protein
MYANIPKIQKLSLGLSETLPQNKEKLKALYIILKVYISETTIF